MHLCEGRPFVILVSGVVEFGSYELDESEKLEYGKNVFEQVINNLRKEHELKFEDKTGCLFEIKYGLCSECSESYIALSQVQNKISFNFITLDLLYPFYRPEILGRDILKTKEFVVRLLRSSLPNNIRDACEIQLINLRYTDSPYSLDVLSIIPQR